MAEDYEKLKQTLDQLKDAQAQLVQSEKMASLGVLAAGVAHEINNPTSYIIGNMDTLEEYIDPVKTALLKTIELVKAFEEDKPEDCKSLVTELSALIKEEKLDYIAEDMEPLAAETRSGAERIKTIVQGLKSFARADEVDETELEINECIESTLKVVNNELKYKCEVEKNLAELPKIKGYPGQLNQVFMNLLVNSAQAIEEKGTISISTVREGENLIIKFSDTGSGIDPDNLAKLFTPFFTTKPVGKGTGLGLSISYSIIENHGGKIKVDSEKGKGTTFTITLPVERSDERQEAA